MRITSGILRNRRFEVPGHRVRPTMESVREAVFSSLGGSCAGLKVLDLFAGSGSLGLEAWSRGADSVVFVEQDPRIFKKLQLNVQMLAFSGKPPVDLRGSGGLGAAKCIRADAIQWLVGAGERFDLILADPPYDLPNAMAQTLDKIAKHSVLTPGGTLVYELHISGEVEVSSAWNVLRDKVYGKTRVMILKLNRENTP